jgi:hypothetical protein
MEHYVFFIINILLFFIILIIDRHNVRKYIYLSIITLVFAYIFETLTTYLGFWHYTSIPKIPLISLYTWLLYVPYISICYFIGRKFAKSHKLGEQND